MEKLLKKRPGLTIEAILTEAYDLFADEGYEGTSLNKLAQRLNVSKPALYYYFPSKETLFEALFDAVNAQILLELKQLCEGAREKDFFTSMVELGMHDFTALQSSPQLIRVLRQFDFLSNKIPGLYQRAAEQEIKISICHKELISRGVEEGMVRAEDLPYFQRLITSLINGLCYEMITTGRSVQEEEWRWMLERILFTGN